MVSTLVLVVVGCEAALAYLGGLHIAQSVPAELGLRQHPTNPTDPLCTQSLRHQGGEA